MKLKLFLLTLVALFLSGCFFASAPPRVKEDYLKRATADESKKIAQLSAAIVAMDIADMRRQSEKNIEILKQRIKAAESKLSALDGQKRYLVDKEKLYVLTGDAAKRTEAINAIKENESDFASQGVYLEYLKAKIADEEVLLKVKQAELGLKVAELKLAEARIARKFQDSPEYSIPGDEAKDPKDAKALEKDKINLVKYEQYLTAQSELLAKEKEKQRKTADILKQAEDRLKESGFKVE